MTPPAYEFWLQLTPFAAVRDCSYLFKRAGHVLYGTTVNRPERDHDGLAVPDLQVDRAVKRCPFSSGLRLPDVVTAGSESGAGEWRCHGRGDGRLTTILTTIEPDQGDSPRFTVAPDLRRTVHTYTSEPQRRCCRRLRVKSAQGRLLCQSPWWRPPCTLYASNTALCSHQLH
jgi:hypothetical protein